MDRQPGVIALFGSGETSPDGQRVHDLLMRRLPTPVRVSVLETPAGFELNSSAVAGRLADFLRDRLPNYRPQLSVIAARARGTAFSPDDPTIAEPIYKSDYILAGPGSPTYAARQLRDSLTWHATLARHRMGATLVLASAMAVAVSRLALPVYEIYKVGTDLHWAAGLDLLGPFGASVIFVPHWNNREGGADLDTSCCFMGVDRFAALTALLPANITIVGIDERTAFVIDLAGRRCEAVGAGSVTVIRGTSRRLITPSVGCDLDVLGNIAPPLPDSDIPAAVWARALAADVERAPVSVEPPAEVLALRDRRAVARAQREWAAADAIRKEIAALGWSVVDTPAGPELRQVEG